MTAAKPVPKPIPVIGSTVIVRIGAVAKPAIVHVVGPDYVCSVEVLGVPEGPVGGARSLRFQTLPYAETPKDGCWSWVAKGGS